MLLKILSQPLICQCHPRARACTLYDDEIPTLTGVGEGFLLKGVPAGFQNCGRAVVKMNYWRM
jgi:hypothetical protein